MTYAHVENGTVVKTGSRPNWRTGDAAETARPLTDAELIEHGRYCVQTTPAFDPSTHKLVPIPMAEWAVNETDVGPTHMVVPLTAEELATASEAERASLQIAIDAERDQRIAAGFTFGGKLYQSRPEDRENISGAALAALAAQIGGALTGDLRWHGGGSDFVWIAADNSLTPMDAQTMFSFGQAAMAHKQAHIFAARALKDAEPIPADYAEDSYWP